MALLLGVRLGSKSCAVEHVRLLVADAVESVGEMIGRESELSSKRHILLANDKRTWVVGNAVRPLHEVMTLGRSSGDRKRGALSQASARLADRSALASRQRNVVIDDDLHLVGRRRIAQTRVGRERKADILYILHLARSLVAIAEHHRLATLAVAACTEIETVATGGQRQHLSHATAFVADERSHVVLRVIQLLSGAEHHIEIKTHVVAVGARIDAPCVGGRSRDTMEERHEERDYRHCMSDNRTFHCVSFLWFSVRQSYDRCSVRRCIQQQRRRHPTEKKCRCHSR